MLIGRKPWFQQPPRLLLPVAEPYAHGLAGLITCDGGGDQIVGGSGWANTGLLIANGLRGAAQIQSAGHTTNPTPNWALQAPASWLTVFAPTQHLTATGAHLEVNDRFFIQSRYSNFGVRYFTISTSGTSYSYENSTWSLTRPNHALLVWDGATAKTFIDGELMHSAACTGTISYGAFSYSNVRARVQAGAVALAAIWQRALTDREGLALTRNPWQLFKPRRVWMPAGASAVDALVLDPSGQIIHNPTASPTDRKLFLGGSGQLLAKTTASPGDRRLTIAAGAWQAAPPA